MCQRFHNNSQLFLLIFLAFYLATYSRWGLAEDDVQNTPAAIKRLAVVEVRDETGSPDWRNQLIAIGIANLVATELYNTGRYAPIEDKPEILRELNELQTLSWLGKGFDLSNLNQVYSRPEPAQVVSEDVSQGKGENTGSGHATADTQVGHMEPEQAVKEDRGALEGGSISCEDKPISIFDRFGCDAVAKVVVKNFKTRRVRTIGFMSAGSTTIELEVEVSVEERDGGAYRGVGKGEATTTAMAAMFQIQDNRICFDATTVGQATQKAVRQAVANLCKMGG